MARATDDKKRLDDGHTRRGFTLVELLVALLLLDVGLLALVGLGITASREGRGGRAALRAAAVASARVERLGSVPCGDAIAAVVEPSAALREAFTDTPGPNHTRSLRDSVRIATIRGPVTVVLATRTRC